MTLPLRSSPPTARWQPSPTALAGSASESSGRHGLNRPVADLAQTQPCPTGGLTGCAWFIRRSSNHSEPWPHTRASLFSQLSAEASPLTGWPPLYEEDVNDSHRWPVGHSHHHRPERQVQRRTLGNLYRS